MLSLCNTILCNCIFSKYTLHFTVMCLGAYSLGGFCPKGLLSKRLISQEAYSSGGFCPKGGFVQGAYISGGL